MKIVASTIQLTSQRTYEERHEKTETLSEGNDALMALGKVGIGAIYLGNLNTLFELKDQGQNPQGQVAATGIYLK